MDGIDLNWTTITTRARAVLIKVFFVTLVEREKGKARYSIFLPRAIKAQEAQYVWRQNMEIMHL